MMVCPVCGKYLFAEVGDYDICPVCNWENDPIQSDNPDFSGGANVMSLNEGPAKHTAKLPVEMREFFNIWTGTLRFWLSTARFFMAESLTYSQRRMA